MQARLTQSFVRDALPQAHDIAITDDALPGFQLRIRTSGKKSWLFRYRVNGGPQQRLKLGNYPGLTADNARKLALVAFADVSRGTDVQLRKREVRAETARLRASTLEAFLDQRYEPWARANLHTWAFQLKRIRSDFEDWLKKAMISIDIPLVEKWRAGRIEIGNQAITINRNLQRLHAVLSKAVEWKAIDRHPFSGIKPLRHDRSGRVRYLEEDEEAQLRDALIAREDQLREERARFNQWRLARGKAVLPLRDREYVDHLRPISLLALNTGLRRSELFHLKLKDVNLKTKWLVVVGRTSKNKQTRRIPLNIEATKILEAWLKQSPKSLASPYVFPGVGNNHLTTITTAWRSVRKLAQLEDFNFHDLRHHFASRLVQSGVDLNSVRELLGHADIKMVLHYAHLAPGGLACAVEKVARPTVTDTSVAA